MEQTMRSPRILRVKPTRRRLGQLRRIPDSEPNLLLLRLLRGGRPTGLEPATARTTIWSSTIELRPPLETGDEKTGLSSFCLRRGNGQAGEKNLIMLSREGSA